MPGFDILPKQLYSSRTPNGSSKVLNPPLLYLVNPWRLWDDRFKVLGLYTPHLPGEHLKHPKILTT
jgi:hypothetical protein